MRWTLKDKPDSNITEHLSKTLGIDLVLSSILAQRGIENFDKAKYFFRPSLQALHDPFLMQDMKIAVERIIEAINQNEYIMIYGDYDVDGTTAVSLVFGYLNSKYENITTYIPDRYKEGYGISYDGIDFADDNDISLIIALDCGIKALDKVDYAKEKGIDFIICDHHRPGDELPKAIAVLDPKREDCSYPYDELCGCGIGFKLIQALGREFGDTIEELIPYLDLVSTAIAADIVPLTGENRILSYYGLKVINGEPRPGIKALIHQIKKETLDITDVVFIIAPRINAAGRMKHGSYAVELLTEQDFDKAMEMAKSIESYNADRKELDKSITKEALEQIKHNKEEQYFSTVVYDENWHKGVIGIVASRLIEQYYRPTLVFTKSGDKLAASARSVRGFDVYNALGECKDLIEQFGGHKYAAGLTLDPDNYKSFKKKFESVVEQSIPAALRERQIIIDSAIYLSDINAKFFRILQQLGPFGPLNMKPVFMAVGLRDNGYGKRIGADGDHLKLQIISGTDQKTYNAIGFGLGDKIDLVSNGDPFKAVFTIEENHWNGITSLQLNLKDLKLEG
ncbi:single-stranded-DNA-specific exonuclease RecJ [Lutimonas halocynthiae]|uniref:single-stranded-DNA-specific exonuclease RecJ n=1 Tax=Lutimonas halocynthiae TaxID=1446477 RepID=UPI0025B51995|nr:single-stranded-DNA-specific exonuclease RecJ [Lutimonas halocynthiae]MDN3641324.1 single-stranded-DNA-specific exonuclease RecJ [Lutimonas halocynthiae]